MTKAMSIFGQVKRPFHWFGRQAYNTWFWARREESLRQLFDMCLDGCGRRGDYPSDKFKKLLRACGINVTEYGTGAYYELEFRGSPRRFNDWPQDGLVNVNIICDVRDF